MFNMVRETSRNEVVHITLLILNYLTNRLGLVIILKLITNLRREKETVI